MFLRLMMSGLVAVGMMAWASGPTSSSPRPVSAMKSGFLQLNGLKLYYEMYEALDRSPKTVPLLLIPGAFLSTESMKPYISAFTAKRSVIVFDQQGHGRTAETPRKMSYEQFADDAAGLLQALKIERADVMGYSQGGGVALQLALRHPALVNKLISMSATYRKDGWYPSVMRAMESANAKAFVGTPIEAAFKEHSQDAKAFEAYVAKVMTLNIDDQNITDAQMRSIQAQTMVVVGDADGVKPEHAVAMFRLCGGGDEEAAATGVLNKVPAARLVMLPAMSHLGMAGQAKVLEPMITPFLDDVMPDKASPF